MGDDWLSSVNYYIASSDTWLALAMTARIDATEASLPMAEPTVAARALLPRPHVRPSEVETQKHHVPTEARSA